MLTLNCWKSIRRDKSMGELVSFIFMMAGKDFLEVCACFFISGIFLSAFELKEIRKEISAKEIVHIIEKVTKEEQK